MVKKKTAKLLRWAIDYVSLTISELEDCHKNHSTGKIEGTSVRAEIKAAKRWIGRANREAARLEDAA